MRVLERVTLPSSSSWNEDGLSPPPAVKSKSWLLFGCASLTTTTVPGLWFVNVHVTASPLETSMFETVDPSEHVADESSQPLGVVSDSE